MRKRKTILVAEDSEGDAFVLQRAFEKAQIDADVRFVTDGQEAVDYLAGIGKFEDRKANPLPRLLLLDLKMPLLDGFDVLRWMRKQPVLYRLPVAVLTSSNLDNDVDRAYDLGANSYIVKPGSLMGYAGLVQTLHKYWAELNRPCSEINDES